MHRLTPTLARQQGIECATQIAGLRRPALGAEKTAPLPERMDARIGASCTCRRCPAAHQAFEPRLEIGLDGTVDGLPLPPCEAPPVVLNHRKEGAARHRGNMQLVVTI